MGLKERSFAGFVRFGVYGLKAIPGRGLHWGEFT